MSRNFFLGLILVCSLVASLGAAALSKKKKRKAVPQVAAFNVAVGTEPLPGMPPVQDASDIYLAGHPNKLDEAVKKFPHRIYVPNSSSNTVDVIDPKKYKVIDHFAVGHQPQHVVPSWDMKTLWVLNDLGDSLTKIDPATGVKGETVPVEDPYNMYYTPDGKYAIVCGGSARAARFPRSGNHEAGNLTARPLQGRRPRRFFRIRPLFSGKLRIFRHDRQSGR